MTAEEYICSAIINNEVETSTIKRKDDYFLAQLGGEKFYKFDVIAENDYIFSIVHREIPSYLIIYQISKQTLKFKRQEVGFAYVLEGKCVLRD